MEVMHFFEVFFYQMSKPKEVKYPIHLKTVLNSTVLQHSFTDLTTRSMTVELLYNSTELLMGHMTRNASTDRQSSLLSRY